MMERRRRVSCSEATPVRTCGSTRSSGWLPRKRVAAAEARPLRNHVEELLRRCGRWTVPVAAHTLEQDEELFLREETGDVPEGLGVPGEADVVRLDAADLTLTVRHDLLEAIHTEARRHVDPLIPLQLQRQCPSVQERRTHMRRDRVRARELQCSGLQAHIQPSIVRPLRHEDRPRAGRMHCDSADHTGEARFPRGVVRLELQLRQSRAVHQLRHLDPPHGRGTHVDRSLVTWFHARDCRHPECTVGPGRASWGRCSRCPQSRVRDVRTAWTHTSGISFRDSAIEFGIHIVRRY